MPLVLIFLASQREFILETRLDMTIWKKVTYLGSWGSTCLHFWQVLARVVCFCLFSSFAGKKIWRKTWLIMATTINLHSIKRRILSPWSLFCPKDKNQNRSGRNENSFWLSWIFFAVQNITWKWLHVSHAWDLVALLRKTFVVITGLEGRLFCHNIFTIHCTNIGSLAIIADNSIFGAKKWRSL